MAKIISVVVEVIVILESKLDEDERAVLMLPPKFGIRRKLCTADIKTDERMRAVKSRYQIHKEKLSKEIVKVFV